MGGLLVVRVVVFLVFFVCRFVVDGSDLLFGVWTASGGRLFFPYAFSGYGYVGCVQFVYAPGFGSDGFFCVSGSSLVVVLG